MTMAYISNENIGKVRLLAVRMVLSGKSTREVARHFGYNQSTIVRWCKRKNEVWHNKSGIPTKSSRPKTSPRRTSRDIEAMTVGVREEIKRCSEVVYHILKKRGVEISLSTVKRVLNRYSCLKKRSPWKKRKGYPLRPDIPRQGDLVEFDTVHFIDKDGFKTYVYTAIDVYSRYEHARWYKKAKHTQHPPFLKESTIVLPV
jgi:transposase